MLLVSFDIYRSLLTCYWYLFTSALDVVQRALFAAMGAGLDLWAIRVSVWRCVAVR